MVGATSNEDISSFAIVVIIHFLKNDPLLQSSDNLLQVYCDDTRGNETDV